ncbi:hypothetical protein ACRS7B_11220 [Staphylococcus aureus]
MKMRLQQAFFNSSQAQQREIGFPISTGNASWGGQHREFRKEILQAMRVGVCQHREFRKEILQAMRVGVCPTQRISKRNSTSNASWGVPTQKLTKSQLTIMCKLAGQR